MKGKVTQEILDKMISLRKSGATYEEIQAEVGIGRVTCAQYLRNVKVDESVAVTLWRQAEIKAKEVLQSKGYIDIIDLNEISPNGYFDILARKDNKWWLFDVTINEAKDLANKTSRLVTGYRCGILYFSHDLNEHRIVELVII